jgi:hypothetical protein
MQIILQGFSAFLANPEMGLPPEQGKALSLTCERWLLCTKVLRRMLLFGFQSDAKSVQVRLCSFHLNHPCQAY